MSEYQALAAVALKYWWWLAASMLATAWCFVQIIAGRTWAQSAMKILLAVNAAVVGWLYFTGVFPPSLTRFPVFDAWDLRWVSRALFFLYLLSALLWLLDAFLSRTPLVLPQRLSSRIQIIAGCILALVFPLYELIGGWVFPRAQAFGDGPAPYLIFTLALLGGSRPDTWVGRLLLMLTAALSLETGLLEAALGGRWHYLLVLVVAVLASVYGLRRRRMVSLARR